MRARVTRRAARAASGERIGFLDPAAAIARTAIPVEDARAGDFTGSAIPADLQRQWIQGTGPAARPRATVEQSIRNVAYALLSGADGWMFDGEDALGQISTDVAGQPAQPEAGHRTAIRVFLRSRRARGRRDERVGRRASSAGPSSPTGGSSSTSRRRSSAPAACTSTTATSAVADGRGFSASIVDAALYVVEQPAPPARRRARRWCSTCRRSRPPRKPRCGTTSCRRSKQHLGLPVGTIKTYVLVEQVEACFQLMEIRAALGPHFVGFNTGRWDYINSVSDAMAWDPAFVNPNIDAITMTYGYMRNYEDRVRRAVQHAGPLGPVRALAGRHGAEHPGRLGGRRRRPA